ncbi:DUF58 domain-containing protein [Gordonia sp. zg691]|uniref:DUF58 domain-containing protein n=1 Tax=Gordonia jinghuaiqii TaxID=2758710 RepID=A0A7D7LWJ5_9ACTN|nr:DUF58 domain-containing protein [Gordonia jinghuaiqii]MBD0862796.1 DUF58 domain-containing protein [Gordonia jinghuaiqii]MCR5979080.1 DUF58 domain-containing protein [Gordonia jinghuaiqii]QMT01599.1 DUF58 domain-containing protein [Gordonia jinghuaiqii]
MFLTGRFLLLVLFGAIPILVWPNYAVPLLWVLFCVLLMCLDLALAGSTKTIGLARSVPGPVRLGESTTCPIAITNHGTGTFRGVLRDSWQPSAGAVGTIHRVSVPASETRTVTTTLTPERRGDRLAVRVTVRRLGPLGLAGRQRGVPLPGRVRALPPFGSRRLLPSRLAHLRQLDGRSAVRVRGQGTEFDSLRDYVEGDDVRSIDWRATARRRSTVVRTWQPEKDRHIVIVLDTSRTSAGRVGDIPRLDAAMDAALLLAALASHAGDRVDLIAGDRRVHRRVAGVGRTMLLNNLVTAMADLEPALLEADWPMLGAEVAKISRQRALLVLLTPLEPAAVEESLLPPLSVLAQRYKVVIGSVADPSLETMLTERGNAGQVYDAAAAARTITLRNRTATAVSRLGVDVVDAPPDKLPAKLADHYLQLKSRGLL